MLTKLGLIAALLGAFTVLHGASASAFEGRGGHRGGGFGWHMRGPGRFGRGFGHRAFRYARPHYGWHRGFRR